MGTPWTYQQESRRPVCGAPSPERCVVAGVKSDGGCSAKSGRRWPIYALRASTDSEGIGP